MKFVIVESDPSPMQRKIILSIILPGLFLMVIAVFWQQELKYLTPTPVPAGYRPVAVRQTISLPELGVALTEKPVHLHFFNPDCPCSRFNLAHFVSLVKEYGKEVNFYVILQHSTDTAAVAQMLASRGITLPVLLDIDETLATKCGVYASPQAVILDKDQQLFYRGNYNRTRYCTDRQTSYARLALEALRTGNEPLALPALATTAYGCELKENTSLFLNPFNF